MLRARARGGGIFAGCKVLANTEYLARHNRPLMILAITWAKEHELVKTETVWYKERWERGTVLENNKSKLIWNFEFKLEKQRHQGDQIQYWRRKMRKRFGYVTWPVPSNGVSKRKGIKREQIIANWLSR